MKKIILLMVCFGIVMLMLTTTVFGATPSCGSTINASVTFDSDVSCNEGDWSFYIDSDDVVVDCAGYTITTVAGNYNQGFYTDSDNITIRNCIFNNTDIAIYTVGATNVLIEDNQWLYDGVGSDWFAFVYLEGQTHVIRNNYVNIISSYDSCSGECNIFAIFPTSNWNVTPEYDEIYNNDVTYSFNSTNHIFYIYFHSGGTLGFEGLNITNNTFTNNGIESYAIRTQLPSVDNTQTDFEIYDNNFYGLDYFAYLSTNVSGTFMNLTSLGHGNYYEGFSCTDGNSDGLCDSPLLDDNEKIQDFAPLVSSAPYIAPCTPDWSCDGYGDCLENNTQECNSVVDNNVCGEEYSGDYTEFDAQACDYCTPDWSCDGYANCLENDTQECNSVVDNNVCGEEYSGDYTEFDAQACDYCTPDWSCDGYANCLENDTQECNSVVDNNVCGEEYSGDYTEFDAQACDYCTPDWQLEGFWGACETPEFLQYKSYADINFCGEFETQPADINRTCGKSNFDYGDSTDFEQVADPTNVSNAVIETPYGYIKWVNPINIVGYDLDNNIIITDNLLSVNKVNLHESLNSECNVAFHMTPRTQEEDTCEKFLLYYSPDFFGSQKDMLKAIAEGKVTLIANKNDIGLDCKDPTVCKNIECSNDVLTFTAQHWSVFGLGDRPYTSDDLAPALFDGIVRMLLTFVAFAGLIVMVLIGSWGFKKMNIKIKR